MTLIHTALLCEAMPIIQRLKLKKISKNFYQKDKIYLLVSGIGEKNTKRVLNDFLYAHEVKKAINIGIAGCGDKNIAIGDIFCINKTLPNIPSCSLTSVKKPTDKIDTTLVDMEAKFFSEICKKYEIEYIIFKVVSDYLDDTIPKKEFVSSLIQKSLDRWIKLI